MSDHFKLFVFDPDAEPPAESPIFDGFLTKGDLCLWVGREKHRKTNMVLQCAICAALGKNFLWFPFSASGPLKVVFIDYESKSSSLWRRYRAICDALGLSSEEKGKLKENLQIIEVRQAYKAGQPFPPFSSAKGKKGKPSLSFWSNLTHEHPADLYIIDPMRCFHDGDENDSRIEQLLRCVRQHFPNSAVILTHHMVKASGEYTAKLDEDMRSWSDGARGSGAIKAHADVIVCQERTMVLGDEILRLGAFMKDGADAEPTALEESDAKSFFWVPRPEIPHYLQKSFDILKEEGSSFANKGEAVACLKSAGIKQPTAYRHVDEMKSKGLLVIGGKGLILHCPEKSVAQKGISTGPDSVD
jgi:hypothetical protein